jgi:hypothetical protein
VDLEVIVDVSEKPIVISSSEHGGPNFFLNAGIHLQDYTLEINFSLHSSASLILYFHLHLGLPGSLQHPI